MKIKIHKLNSELPIADYRLPIGPNHAITGRSQATRIRKSKIENAFTLVEMLLVVTIIGILAALVIPKLVGRSEQTRVTAAYTDIHGGIKSALDQFEVDNGFYPRSLQDLVTQPSNAKNWHGPYLDKLPVDPWQNAYIYYYPGKHTANSYDLLSVGPDGKEGTEDDVVSWK